MENCLVSSGGDEIISQGWRWEARPVYFPPKIFDLRRKKGKNGSTSPPREAAARELYQKLRAVPQGDDKPWIEPWLGEEELFPDMDWNMEIEKAVD